MKLVEDYILLSRETRRSHLRLEDPCIIRGGDSFQMRGLLAHILNTTIPTNLTKKKILVCHACHNGNCGNPYHLYWGTYYENRMDSISNGGYLSPYHFNLDTYGADYAKSRNKRSPESAALSGKGNKGKPKSVEHKKRISESIKKHHQLRKNS